MQTSPKTPKKIFATRLVGVILCLVISLSAVITPARGQVTCDPVMFGSIATALADDGITSNIGSACDNWTAFPGLYFEKWTIVGGVPTTAIGKMTFTDPINFMDEETQAFLLALQAMQMSEGYIALDLSAAAGFKVYPATLVMYRLPVPTTLDQLVVRDDAGNIIDLTQNMLVSDFSQEASGDVTFRVAHFTSFEIGPKHIYLPLIIR